MMHWNRNVILMKYSSLVQPVTKVPFKWQHFCFSSGNSKLFIEECHSFTIPCDHGLKEKKHCLPYVWQLEVGLAKWEDCEHPPPNSSYERTSSNGSCFLVAIAGIIIVVHHLLTHWGWDKMAAIFQTTHSNTLSWMKMYEFWLEFHWSLFLRVQLTIFQHWFR